MLGRVVVVGLVAVLTAAGAASAAPGGIVVVGAGTVDVDLPGGQLRVEVTGSAPVTAVHLQGLSKGSGAFGLLVAPALDPDLRQEIGSSALPRGRYRVHVVGAGSRVRLVLPGLAGSVLSARARPSERAAAKDVAIGPDGALATVLREGFALPARGVAWVAGAATHGAVGATSVRMGGCVTAPGALCEQGAFAGRLSAGPAGTDEWVVLPFVVDSEPREVDLGAYVDAGPTMTRFAAAFAVVDLT